MNSVEQLISKLENLDAGSDIVAYKIVVKEIDGSETLLKSQLELPIEEVNVNQTIDTIEQGSVVTGLVIGR